MNLKILIIISLLIKQEILRIADSSLLSVPQILDLLSMVDGRAKIAKRMLKNN